MNPQTYGSTERQRFRVDDSLDCFVGFVMGAIAIALAVGLFATPGLTARHEPARQVDPWLCYGVGVCFLLVGLVNLLRPQRIKFVVVTESTLIAERRWLGTLVRSLDALWGVQADGSPCSLEYFAATGVAGVFSSCSARKGNIDVLSPEGNLRFTLRDDDVEPFVAAVSLGVRDELRKALSEAFPTLV